MQAPCETRRGIKLLMRSVSICSVIKLLIIASYNMGNQACKIQTWMGFKPMT